MNEVICPDCGALWQKESARRCACKPVDVGVAVLIPSKPES